MAIDTNTPLTREEWNEDIIQLVNDLCLNPNEGCNPIEPLEKIEPNHIWIRTDIIDVQNKLKEICNENEFDELDELWDFSDIIQPILSAITIGWCNCEPSVTIQDLGSIPVVELEAGNAEGSSAPSIKVVDRGCGGTDTWTYESPWFSPIDLYIPDSPDPEFVAGYYTKNTEVRELNIEIEEIEANIERFESEIEGLEEEITQTEFERDDLIITRDYYCIEFPGGAQCISYTAQVEAKEDELSELGEELAEKQEELATEEVELNTKEGERDAAEAERTTHRTNWDNWALTDWEAIKNQIERYPTDINPYAEYFPEMEEPWGDYFEDTGIRITPIWYYTLLEDHSIIRDSYWSDSNRPKLPSGTEIPHTNGSFSPSGYPYVVSLVFRLIDNADKWSQFTLERICLCPWELPSCSFIDGSGPIYRIPFHDVLEQRLKIVHAPDY